MSLFALSHPTATVSRGIENMVLAGNNSKNLLVKGGCFTVSRLVSITVFPIFIMLEIVFIRAPKLVLSIGNYEKFHKRHDKLVKFVLGFIFSPLGLHSPEGVSGFYLKNVSRRHTVLPFGVESVYGKVVDQIHYPKTIEDLQGVVRQAKLEKKQISIIGAGMSQGTQTIPKDANQVVINTKYLNKIRLADDKQTVSIQSGAIWEQVQLLLNRHGKSTIVKQASDLFSVGGTIGMNAHGWAHEYGAIASTVVSLQIINADGDLQTLTPQDELFGCMFGTMGYFGVVVSVTLRVVDNDHLIEKTEEVDIAEFSQRYKTDIKGKDIPLFGGRLVLDNVHGTPLRKVCMVRYEKDREAASVVADTRGFYSEPTWGTRVERVALKLVAHLSNFSTKHLLSWFWSKERNAMFSERRLMRNEALHPPINAFKMLHHSNLHTQWLQEYFIKEDNLHQFLLFLGAELKANGVRVINATIRPTPKDTISILPYAEQDRHAVVISFSQVKNKKEMQRTRDWIERVNAFLVASGDKFYQAYMPYATREQFEKCYPAVKRVREMKEKYDPTHLFGNGHTAKYYDRQGG